MEMRNTQYRDEISICSTPRLEKMRNVKQSLHLPTVIRSNTHCCFLCFFWLMALWMDGYVAVILVVQQRQNHSPVNTYPLKVYSLSLIIKEIQFYNYPQQQALRSCEEDVACITVLLKPQVNFPTNVNVSFLLDRKVSRNSKISFMFIIDLLL